MSACRDRVRHWGAMWRLARVAGTRRVVAAVSLNVVLGLLPLVFVVCVAALLGRIPEIGHVSAGQRWGAVVWPLGVSVAVFVLQQLLEPFRHAIAESLGRVVDSRCAGDLMSTVLTRTPLRSLERQDTLDLLVDSRSAFEGQAFTPGDAVGGVVSLVYRYVNLAGAVVLVGVVLGPGLAVVAGVTALVIRFGQRGSLDRFAAMWGGLAGLRRRVRYVRDVASAPGVAKEVRVLGLLDWVLRRHAVETDAILRPLWRARRELLLRPFVWLAVVCLVGGTAVLLGLAWSIAGGNLSIFQMTVALQGVLVPLRFGVYFPESDTKTQYGMRSLASMRELQRAEAEPVGDAGATVLPGGSTIRFEDVVFRYAPEGPVVLDHLDLEIEEGRSTAVVGLNGAGKTTLVKLLTRLHDPESGRVTVGGTDLRDIDPRAWQRRCAVIFQDYVRYELSAGANVRMGAPGVTEPALVGPALARAIDKAGLGEIVDALPHGAETVLSRQYDDGHELSGGQWQRVGLARALYAVEHGAGVLVLDEPTAQFDARAEARFYDEFLGLTKGLTTVVISHRFAAVRRADRIVVLENGKVAESGTHDELVAAGGRYAELFRLQAQRFHDVLAGDPVEVI
ncbi:hypothetical protein UK23_06130 [Lentzea aerocolonigenes]|uniref:ABC transporter domain-containing protein n=1 Tax=Lentzea aerocolonigenes TaxID=68170 RepID=A0A0F0H7J0_LENAE|nr:hypothetical protein UK23_06130 [Lentzea aerocolonigenes]